MDNSTYIKISQDEAQKQDTFLKSYKMQDYMVPFSIPFYEQDQTSIACNQRRSKLTQMNCSAALISFSKNLAQMVKQTLRLQEQGQLTDLVLENLLAVIDLMEPEVLAMVMASDLDLYRDLYKLNETLMSDGPQEYRQYEMEDYSALRPERGLHKT